MSKVITLENLEVFKQECDKAYASKEEIITATVDCSHKYEITGNTGDEHGLAIDNQQMLIKKIQGHSRRKSLNLFDINKTNITRLNNCEVSKENNTFVIKVTNQSDPHFFINNNGFDLIDGKTYYYNFFKVSSNNNTRLDFWGLTTAPLENPFVYSKNVDYHFEIEDYEVGNTYKFYFSISEKPLEVFQPYDNTLVNSNNILISTGRNILNPDDFGAKCHTYDKATGIATIVVPRDTKKVFFENYYFAPNTQYTIILDAKTTGTITLHNTTNLQVVYTDGTYDSLIVGTNTTNGKSIKYINRNFFDGNVTTFNVNNCAIIKGANQDFEPYKQDTITTIGALGEFDYILPQSNQKVIQTSQVVTLNGSESFREITSQALPKTKLFAYNTGLQMTGDSIVSNSKYGNAYAGIWAVDNVSIGNSENEIFIRDNFTTIDQLKQWLSQNPIQLVYKLATPTIINDGPIPNGMAVYNGGLQIQQGDVPYTITKQYNLSQKAQILANIEVDREQAKMIEENNQKFNLIPKFSHVDINLPETSMNGTLTEEEFKILQANDLNYIMFNKEIYMLSDKTHTIDTLTYSHVGYENHKHMLKTISVTVSTRAWVLNTTEIMTGDSGSDTQSLLGVWVLNETINHNVSSYKSFIMTFNSNGIRSVDFRLASDNRIFYEQYPIGGVQKTIEVYNSTSKWNTKTPSYRSIQITDISALNTEEKITLATFLKTNAVKAQDFIIINQPSTATNGILTQEQINKLQANDLNYIIFANEIYALNDKTHTADTLTYSHVGFENGKHLLKTISITVSTRAWVLNTTSVVDSYEYRMFKINNPSDNISTSIKEIYIYTNKFDTASRFQDFLQNAYDGDMIFAFPCIAITPTDTIINAQIFYDLNIDPSSYLIIFNDKSEYVAHQNLVVVESA